MLDYIELPINILQNENNQRIKIIKKKLKIYGTRKIKKE